MSTTYNQNTVAEPPKIEYCLYARKSSESDERQAMSIDSQIDEMLTLAKRDNEIELLDFRLTKVVFGNMSIMCR